MNLDFIFIIYSCKKNISKSEFLFHLINNKLTNCKCYIIYGDNLSTDYEIKNYEIKNDKYLILNCSDYYENLSQKTISLFNIIEKIHPTVKGVFKCDDDILPNIIKLNELFTFILNNKEEIPYLGNIMKKEHISYEGYHREKVHNKNKYDKNLIMYNCIYVTGPLYYLNMSSIRTFNIQIQEFIKDKEITEYLYEDNIVGYILNSQNIYPIHYKTYYDDFSLMKHGCFQNINNQIRNLFIHMHGGLGNQLFQVVATYEIAKKHNMNLVLVYKEQFWYHMSHNTHIDEFFSTIFKHFNTISYNDIDFSNVITYHEPKCFEFYDNIIQQTSKDYYMEGYFQNKKYVQNYTSEILELFQNPVLCKEISTKYILLDESYFIHIRMGDYINNPTYKMDRDNYFINAINYIMHKEEDLNVHFFIVSDNIDFCKTNYIFRNIPRKTFMEKMSTLDTLYFMSLCKKGGICSNSTFSGWATNLNTNPKKTVVVPKQWINIDYNYEIPFEYTICL
jgi:hypothetical protein